ncbi:AAA family ATPase [Streptomyces sp. R302]|uniref:adenylate/guanylate cyclase domain-containing protein n=1 Tax=unclassified Streptomyces TaxID=2593676 RepID=UPI00145DA7BB|nr:MULTISPECIES: adenylate/guanylate cyclase domain-containing protein [unclassified Streptomyces]NML51053.1 AAA family ATPase [Streptomyces sp. R301]NML81148.1 AAA family ATPase [Streptomyces sp. R302]
MPCPTCRQALPPEARFCAYCGTARPAPLMGAEDERKPVTVLFCDLVGSTALSGTLDPETLRVVTLRYFGLMSEQIEVRGGTPEKFIGDAVMAVFGVPTVQEDDARRALGAALGMREALAGLNAELEATLGIRLSIRIGVNTGQVVAAARSTARQALVSGETVNVAARLEQNAAPGEILVGPETLLAAGPTAVVEEVGPLALHGKTEPVRAHRLLALGTDDPELLRRFDVPFIGREAERAALDRALDGTEDGAAALLLVGEAGVGKTRLVREWRDARLTRGPLAHGSGRCRSYGEHGSLTPLADAVREILTTPPVTPVTPATPVTPTPPEPPGPDGPPRDALALLRNGLLRDGTPNAPLEDLCAALAVVLRWAARSRPVLLVLDDWQWAAPLLVRTLDRVHALLGRTRVLTVRLVRPDGAAPPVGQQGDRVETLRLSGLPGPETALLARELVGVDATPPSPELFARAEGNPLFLEQLLVPQGAAAEAERYLPPTLQALLGARIGALDPVERAVLDLASVVGREFTSADLVRLHARARAAAGAPADGPAGGADVDGGVVGTLARLGRRRLVEPSPGKPGLHRFSGGLVHEVAYASLSKRAKADRHEWAAGLPSVLAAGPGAVGGHLERAHHYRVELGLLDERTARLGERAAEALGEAGAQALSRSDLHWAESLLRRAVELLAPGAPARLSALRRLGEVRVAQGQAEEGAALLREVLDADGPAAESAHARLALAVLDPAGGGVVATARRVLPVFEAAADSVGQARARLRLAQQLQHAGRHEEADRDLVRALAHAAEAEAEPERAATLGAIGVSLWRGPEPVETALSRCRALLAEHGTGRPTVRVTLNCPLAVLYALRGRPADARAALAEAERLAAELDYAEVGVFLPVFRATAEALLGHRGRALALLGEADTTAAALGAAGFRQAIALDAARLALDMNRRVSAERWLAGLADARRLPRADVVELAGLRARLAARGGDAEEARRQADTAVRTAELTDSPLVRATAALDRARTLAALGLPGEAGQAAWSAVERFTDKGHARGAREARRFLAGLTGAGTDERSRRP